MKMRWSVLLPLFVLCAAPLGCDDNDTIDAIVTVTDGTVQLEWSGPNVHHITLGESSGPTDEAECDPGRNVWWALQVEDGTPAPRLVSPFCVGETQRV